MVAKGCMSREEDIISGVLQGTVLEAIRFVFMISDIDEDVEICIIRCFADDTRVNKRIKQMKIKNSCKRIEMPYIDMQKK